MDGVFGQASPEPDPATTVEWVDEADIYLGYAKPQAEEPEPDAAPQTQNAAQGGAEDAGEGDSSSEGASAHPGAQEGDSEGSASQGDPAAAWAKEKEQYQQAIQQYEQTLDQLLSMFQTNPYAQAGQGGVPGMVPGAPPQMPGQGQSTAPVQAPMFGPGPVPGQLAGYSVDPVTGYPVPQGVAPTPQIPGAVPQQAPGQNAAAPAAQQVNDEELTEQFWQEPVKAARTLVEREWDRLLQERLMPLIQQREAYFGQVFGQQIMAPLVQQVAMVQDEIAWRDRISREYQTLRSKFEDFDEVAPVLRQMLNEDPQTFAKLRQGQATLESLYEAAKKRGGNQRQLTAVPGGKGAARMPRAGAARVKPAEDNDALVEAALGPVQKGGIWG